MPPKRCCIALAVVFVLLSPCNSYNMEARLPIFKQGPKGSKFGFSLVMHRTTTNDTVGLEGTLLVVGAPSASAIGTSGGRRLINPGGVFYCSLSTDKPCSRVNMDAGGDVTSRKGAYSVTRFKSRQWLGVSLKSQGPGEYLITCAHRSVEDSIPLSSNARENERERICGRCFLLKAKSDRIEEIPSDSEDRPGGFLSDLCSKYSDEAKNQMHRNVYGYNQMGSSIDIMGDEYVLGAPGTWAWSGALFDFNFSGEANGTIVQTPTCYNQKSERTKDRYGQTICANIPLKRNSYIGMSVAMSKAVQANSEKMYYAAGAPRGSDTGAVLLFTKGFGSEKDILVADPSNSVYGERIASSFGYSVALIDINGDKLDDLIVGAPQYFDYGKKHKDGAIYVYLNSRTKAFNFIKPRRFFGSEDSFFGHSIVSLGDMDQDGYNDFAVGAPYEDKNGVVHIFRGGPDGPKESQVIKGSAFGNMKEPLVGFGASMSGSVDADGNKYPDLLVGSLSDSVALIRSRPIITINATLDLLPVEFDIEKKSCRSRGRAYACFKLSYCFTYNGRHEKYTDGVTIVYTLNLDNIRHKNGKPSRLHFDSPDGEMTVIEKITLDSEDRRVCPGSTHKVYFSNKAEDKLTDIEITLKFELNLPEIGGEHDESALIDMSEIPSLDQDVKNRRSSTMRIKNTCGDDGCQSDLKISAAIPKEVYVGSESLTDLEINVSNEGEEAHQAYVEVFLPPNVFLDSTTHDGSSALISCISAYIGESSSFVKCGLGNPYKKGMKDILILRLSTMRLDYRKRTIDATVQGYTTSVNPKILPVELQSQVIVELALSVTGSSRPEQLRYAERLIVGETGMNTTEDIGPSIQYTFIVENTKTQPAFNTILNVQLPVEIDNGKWLLYLVNGDVRAGGNLPIGTCNSTYINPLNMEPALRVFSRVKRSTLSSKREPVAQAAYGGRGYVSKLPLSCEKKNVRCESVECTIGEIEPKATVSINLQMHLWEATFLEEYSEYDLVSISTKAELATHDDHTRFTGNQRSHVVETIVDHEVLQNEIRSVFPWWLILIGVIALLVIYLIVVIILIKCGFFKRKRFARHDEDNNAVLEEKDEHRM